MKTRLLILFVFCTLNSFSRVPTASNKTFEPGANSATLYTAIPDTNFENKLISLGYDSGPIDHQILTANINTITNLNVYDCNIEDLTGIQDFVALIALNCSYNQLTTLDLSTNVALTTLYCGGNQLATLDLTKNVKLIELICYDNQLTTLDVTKHVELVNLYCDGNQLTTLDVTKNVKLIDLRCYYNHLTNLDTSKNIDLIFLQCFKNQLTSLDLTKNVRLFALECHENQLIDLDISKNINLEYILCQSNQLTNLNLKNGNNNNFDNSYIDFKNNINLTCIQVDNAAYSNANWTAAKDVTATYNTNCNLVYTLIPNSNFENKLIALGIDKDGKNGKVLTASINSLTSLNVANSNISDLTGIQDFTALTSLNCNTNQLTTLNLSTNLALSTLNCSGNQLTNLNITNNVNLASIQCYLNQLTTLSISNNTKLTSLICHSNKLTSLDISKNLILTHLECDRNQLTTLNSSKNVALIHLECESNKLIALDVSKNINLTYLYCFSNSLTSLDVSKNIALITFSCSSNKLKDLNLKNGRNTLLNVNKLSFTQNPNLTCIEVDNVNYSNNNWLNKKDIIASFKIDCNAIVLPSNNFAVEFKGESCANEKNGEINITANASYAYVAKINGTNYNFTNNNLKLSNLVPGNYAVTISIPGEIFNQNFSIDISQATTIVGKSSLVANKAAVEITQGTAPYTVFVNGIEQFETTEPYFSVDLQEGGLLEVKTAKACEGIYSKEVNASESLASVYPNPTIGPFEIELSTSKKEVAIGLYSTDGQLISQKTYAIENGKVPLTLDNQTAGLYIIKVNLHTPNYLKIIKN